MRPNALRSMLHSPSAGIRPVATLLGALALLLLGACRSVPDTPGVDVEEIYRGELEAVQPLDVVVAPVQNDSLSRDAPLALLREAFFHGVVKRRYSPLALDYVDRQVVEASYRPGDCQEDAVLQVVIKRWDDSRWDTHARLEVVLEVWMRDAKSGRELWGGRIRRDLELSNERSRFATDQALFREATRALADDVLEVMPARRPQP